MIVTSGITIQFGAKPLFENVSVKFGEGNRYGLIGANGCGKSTFMKILGGELEPSAGQVAIDKNERLGKLRQDQFAFENDRVLDVVMMGHEELWEAIRERDAIYANPDASEEDYMRAADLEATVAEYDGYSAEARAGELLFGLGLPKDLHNGPMSAVAPGFKLRVLLAQALFSDPDILLLDEPTNNLDIVAKDTLLEALKEFPGTVLLVSHDRFILNELVNEVVEVGRGHAIRYLGNYDDYLRKKAEMDLASAGQAAAKINAAKASAKAPVLASTNGIAQADRNGAHTKHEKHAEQPKRVDDREAKRRHDQMQKRRQQLEASIEGKEAERATLATEMNDPSFYLKRKDADELIGRYQQLGREIERLYAELEKLEIDAAPSPA
jgi:ATPase subunit of ABC transporter with duplicated ATPase domains